MILKAVALFCAASYRKSYNFIQWHISVITCQIIMSTCQIFMSTRQIFLSNCQIILSTCQKKCATSSRLISCFKSANYCHLLINLISDEHKIVFLNNYVGMSDNVINLSDNDFNLSDLYVDLSDDMMTCQIILFLSVWYL